MTFFDDNPLKPPDENLPAQPAPHQTAEFAPPEPLTPPLAGDPISYAAATPVAYARSSLPEDLRIPWSWVHLVVFLVFGFASLLVVQIGGVLLLSADKHLSQKQMQQLIESKPQFLVGTNILVRSHISFSVCDALRPPPVFLSGAR
jgi:hypothetical protein